MLLKVYTLLLINPLISIFKGIYFEALINLKGLLRYGHVMFRINTANL